MGVRIEGHMNGGVTEPFGYDFGVNALLQQNTRMGMPQVVKRNARKLPILKQAQP